MPEKDDLFGDDLRNIFGNRRVVQAPVVRVKPQAVRVTTKPTEDDIPDDLKKKAPSTLDRAWACAKWLIVFGGLSCLILYWQTAGLMAESIAVPCELACTAIAGWGVGRNCVGVKKK
jgi:hypothetical protein